MGVAKQEKRAGKETRIEVVKGGGGLRGRRGGGQKETQRLWGGPGLRRDSRWGTCLVLLIRPEASVNLDHDTSWSLLAIEHRLIDAKVSTKRSHNYQYHPRIIP